MANESLNYERQQALSALLRNDFGSFIEKAFNEINGQGTFRSSQHIDLMSKLLEEVIEGRTRRATISIAPRTLKSFVCVVCYVAFVLGRTPTRKFIILSHDLALAEKHADLIRSILDSVWFQSLFPNTRLKPGASRRGNFETTRGGRVYATSIDAGLTGHGADEIIIDDPMDADRARNIVARRELVRTFDEKIVSRLDDNNKGVVLVIAQRLAIDDLVGVLDQRTEFFSLSVPAEATEDLVHSVGEYRWVRPKGDIIDPENLDVDFLESRRKHMGQAAFSSQYQQNPAVAGGGIVERAWLQEFDLVPDGPWTIVLTIDVGQGLNDHSSYSALQIWRTNGRVHYLCFAWRDRLELVPLHKHIVELLGKYAVDHTLVEDAAQGIGLISILRNDQVPVIPIAPKGSKEDRLRAQIGKIRSGEVLVPRTGGPAIQQMIEEVVGFPYYPADDHVDALSQYLSWVTDAELQPKAKGFAGGETGMPSRLVMRGGHYYASGVPKPKRHPDRDPFRRRR